MEADGPATSSTATTKRPRESSFDSEGLSDYADELTMETESVSTVARGKRRCVEGSVPVEGSDGRADRKTIDSLLTPILEECVGYLSAVEISTAVRRISKKWHAISRSNAAWQHVHQRCSQITVPNPCKRLSIDRLEGELGDEGYQDVLQYYHSLFEEAASSCKADLETAFSQLPNEPKDVEKWWWSQPRPSLRRARQMWHRIAADPSIRNVLVGEDHIEEHLTHRKTFTEFQYQVGDLWVHDLYVDMAFLPPVHSRDCGCDMHVHAMDRLVTAEQRYCLPPHLYLHTPYHNKFCEGLYVLQQKKVNGFPCWAKADAEQPGQKPPASGWLYSSPCGIWTFTDREGDFSSGAGHIAASARHHGWMPPANRYWMHGDSVRWTEERHISVRCAATAHSKFLREQKEVTPRIRSAVVGWLCDIQWWHKGPFSMQTLYLATAIIDLYLAKQAVKRDELQILACAAVVVSSRSESPLVLGEAGSSMLERMWHLADEHCSQQCILDKVGDILSVLGHDVVNYPTVYLCLEARWDVIRESSACWPIVQDACEFIAELALLSYDVVSTYRPSVIAAACILVAVRTLPITTLSVVDELRLIDPSVELCAADLMKQVMSMRPWVNAKKAVHIKYSSEAHNRVADYYDSICEV